MAREGRVFKTTTGDEVLVSYDDTIKAVRQWLKQNGIESPSEAECREHAKEFSKRFKIVIKETDSPA